MGVEEQNKIKKRKKKLTVKGWRFPEIEQEKAEVELRERIGSFKKDSLHHVEPQEKTVLPSGNGAE